MKNIRADIKNREFKPIYLLTGEEVFLVHSLKNQLIKAMLGDDSMNLSIFEGKDIDVDSLIDVADTMPFMAEYKLIVISNSGFLKSQAPDKLTNYLDNMPETTHIIMIESDVDKRNKLYKKIDKMGYVADCKHPTASELTRWCGGILKQSEKKIAISTLNRFLEYVGNDMWTIKNELNKLIDYVGERDTIEQSDVDAVVSVSVQNRIFDMVQAITSKKTSKAMELYADLLTLKEQPMRILFLIAKQFNQLLQIKDMQAARIDKNTIAATLKIPVFVVDKLSTQVRGYDKKKLEAYVGSCTQLEEDIKLGNIPDRLAVELLITGAV